MTKGMRSYAKKQRRKIRRENHFARDLRSPIFHQRRIERTRVDGEKYLLKLEEWIDNEA
jgi:hypothetical protein